MVSLLDVNFLIALFDPSHPHHDSAHHWFATQAQEGWATCPLTENGFVRVVCQAKHLGGLRTPKAVAGRLLELRQMGRHEFWDDRISLLDAARFDLEKLPGPSQITDVYLLALAVERHGRLVTFDQSIAWRCVSGATARDIQLLSAA